MNRFSDLERFADRTALIASDGQQYSYNWLLEYGDAVAQQAAPRSLVFLIGSNTPQCIAGYVGFIRRGVVPVLINHTVSQEMIDQLVNAYQPEYIFRPNADGDYALSQLATRNSQLYPELGLILTTSGSTGSPKFVRLTYENLFSNAESIAEYLEIASDDRAITTLPMTYSYGLSIINSHLISGACLILTDAPIIGKDFWTLFKEQNPTTFGGVPFIYDMLKKLRFARMNCPSLKYITQAGGHLSAELVKEFEDVCRQKGIKFIVMYGQTEATARMAYMPWDKLEGRENSIGVAIPGGKFFLIDDEGAVIDQPEVPGELCYRGPNVSLGYATCRAELANGDENGGVLHTGDVAKRDAEGFYYIVGRKKRFLKIYGNRVNLDEVQTLLLKRGIESACVGKDDAMKVYVVTGTDCNSVRQMLAELTHLNQSAFTVLTIDAIPRNDAGKILYSKLEN
ncbi:MAG: AMP-binding protein [Thermoguttaceae bacterium]|nr:AMP-binding protein [Thermoguttaceae bacterium]